MAGKKRKKAVKGKKVTDTRDEDVIQLNIILDLDPGDDFKSAVKRAKSSAQQGPSDLRTYISRGKTISLTPLRIEVPSVESLLQRYGKYLAAPDGSDSGSPLAVSSPKPRDVPPQPATQPMTCNKKKSARPSRSKKKKRTQEIPSLKAEVENPGETCKKRIHNEVVTSTRESNKSDNDRGRDSKIDEDCEINHPPPTKSKGPVETSRKRLPKKHGNSSLPETIEENPSTADGSKVLVANTANSNTRLSLPSRIQLKKDWMKKLFSRSADRKTSKNDAVIQQVLDNKTSSGLTGADKDSDTLPKKNEVNSPDMDKLEPNNTEVEVKVEKDVVNNVIMAVEESNSDAADVPVITEEIGIVTETRLEKILVKQESQDRVDPKQRTYEQVRADDKETNFIQFNEDSYDEEGPTEDPLMLIEDSDVSVIEDDDVIEVPASRGLSSKPQVKNSKVTVLHDFIQATQRSISTAVSTNSEEATMEINCVDLDSAVQLPDDSESTVNTQRSMMSIAKTVCRQNWVDKHATKINYADQNTVAQLPDESDDAVLTFDDRDNYADDTYEAVDEEAVDESDPGDVNFSEHTKAYSCPYCDDIYESSADLEQHGQMQHAKHQHTPKKPYACPLCRKRFSNIRWITAHISRMHKPAKVVVNQESAQLEAESLEFAGNAVSSIGCPYASCTQTFDSQKALKNHILQFHGRNAKSRAPNSYQCKKCPMSFNWQSNLSAHVRFSHNAETKKNKRSTNEDDTSSTSSTAEDHVRFSSPNDSSSGTFPSALGLQRHHSMRHSNGGGFNPRRKYFCSQCPSSYSHSSSLSAHRRYYHHTGKSTKELPHLHPCKICGISFKWSANLNSHMRFMHEERSSTQPSKSSNKFEFTCSECVGVRASFESISLLSKHKRQMHRPIPKQTSCLNPDFVPPTTPHLYNPDGEETTQTSLATHEAALCNEFPTVTFSEDESDDDKQLFQSNEELQEHRSAHTNRIHSNSSANALKAIKEQSYPCSMCHMFFLWPKSLRIHESLVHKIRKQGKKRKKQNQRKKRNQLKKCPPPKQSPTTLNYICVQCDNLSFSSSEDLQRHNQVIHREAFAVALICQSGNEHPGSSSTNPQAQPEVESEPIFPNMNCEDNPVFRSTDFPSCTEQIVIVGHRCSDCFEEFPTLTEFENHATTHSQNYFQCPECPLQFNRASYLLEHQEASHTPVVPAALPTTTYLQGNVSSSNIQTQKPKPVKPQEPLKCSVCTRTFKKQYNLEKHEKLHVRDLLMSASKNYGGGGCNDEANCPVCRCSISQKRNIPRHVESMHKLIMSNRDFTCTVCNKVVQFSPAGVQNYMCCQYEQLRVNMDLLNSETSTVQESYPVKCTLCQVGFDNMDQLKIHNSTCHMPYRNACKVCGKIFKLRINLCRHEKLAHKATEALKKYLTKKKAAPQPGQKAVQAPIAELAVLKFRCAICRVKFSCEAEIKIHIQEAHSMEELPVKPFQCGYCPKIFPTIKGVRHHVANAHKDGLPARNINSRYPCPCCTLTFSTTSRRHNHINSSHKGETPYKCSHQNCDERFETSEALHVHVDSSHAEADTTECTESRNNYTEEDGTPRGPFNPSEDIYGDSDPSLNHYWLQPPHNSSMYQAEQDLSDLLTNMETVEIGGGMMMKGEVELPDYTEPGDLPDFEFQEVLQETGDDQDDADFTFNIISHPPLEENSSENN